MLSIKQNTVHSILSSAIGNEFNDSTLELDKKNTGQNQYWMKMFIEKKDIVIHVYILVMVLSPMFYELHILNLINIINY